jgi:hypothetical protein
MTKEDGMRSTSTLSLVAVAVLLVSVLAACASVGEDPRAEAIAQAVAQVETGEGTMDTMCGAYNVIGAALKGSYGEDVKEITWTAWSDDSEKRAWSVACDGTYMVLTQKGEESITERIFVFLVDYDTWELRYVPGRTNEAQLLGV